MSHAHEEIVGRSVAAIIKKQFEAVDIEQGGFPARRITGFTAAEAVVMERVLHGFRIPNVAQPVTLVVCANPALAEISAGRGSNVTEPTMTWHRNNNFSGLILIDVDPQGDQQGVALMNLLADTDILDPDQDGHDGRIAAVTEAAWSVAAGEALTDPPQALHLAFAKVLAGRAEGDHPQSLRQWVAFCLAASSAVRELNRAVVVDEVNAAVALALPMLGLFADARLFDNPGDLHSRLRRNYFASRLLTPQGKELREDDLAERIKGLVPIDLQGNGLPRDASDKLRSQMKKVCEEGGPNTKCTIDLHHWEQLFSTVTTTLGLGGLIRQIIEQNYSERVPEFEALEVETLLNEGDAAAAARFLQAGAGSENIVPLADAVGSALRKRVERLISRGEKLSSDPLIALLYGLKALDAAPKGAATSRVISLSLEDGVSAPYSEALFGFLYGRTLADIADACDGAIGSKFAVDERLRAEARLRNAVFPAADDDIDDTGRDDDENGPDKWAGLRLVLTSSDASTPLIRFRWEPRDQPGMLAFARLVADPAPLGASSIVSLDEWLKVSFDKARSPKVDGTQISSADDSIATEWSTLRTRHYGAWASEGLSADGILEFLDKWEPLMLQARRQYVPGGAPLLVLDRFLAFESATCQDGRSVIFASHPLRLRWIAAHLRRLSRDIQAAINEDLDLNVENDLLYFNWIEHGSPHRQPPLFSVRPNELQTSVREADWHEEYAAIDSGDARIPDWLSGIDDASVAELVGTAKSFLDAFPQKSSGLSVLILARTGAASLSRRFVERLRSGTQAGIDLELHVMTQLDDHSSVGRELSHLDSDEGRGRTLMPPFRLVLHDWDQGSLTSLDSLKGSIDIAFAPNLFGLNTTPLVETRRNEDSIGGHFDPWLDQTTHLRAPSAGSVNVSQVLLPPAPDPILEAWSTLVVRKMRQSPVADQDHNSTDFVTLQVQFDQNEQLFVRLHDVALWVVTLDPFVGRDQIDALKNAPDVITVKSGIGKNETYTLVVSSSAGGEFVIRRLERRLRLDFGVAAVAANQLAERLYQIGRFVVPGLMLRAVGLGRTTEEILGLILARYAIDQELPSSGLDGLEYWISVDDRANWFGGANQVRPDLLRVRAFAEADGTRIELLVVESKFRRQFDLGIADQQIARALRLLGSAFVPEGEPQPRDAEFWRRELLSAIDELSRREVKDTDLAAVRRIGKGISEANVRSDLRSGRVIFAPAQGIICAVAWAQDIPSPAKTTTAGTPLILLDRGRVQTALAALAGITDPENQAPSQNTSESGPMLDNSRADEGGESRRPPKAPLVASTSPEVQHGAAWTGAPAPFPPPKPSEVIEPNGESGQHAIATVTPPSKLRSDTVSPVLDRHRLERNVLESRYQRILDRLTQLQVKVKPPADGNRYQEGPGFCIYRVVPEQGMATDRVTGRLEDLKLALELPNEQNLRANVDRGSVVFEVPKEAEDRYYVTAQDLWASVPPKLDALSVPIGEDIEGNAVSIDFSSADTPHLLIAGQTGSGKSIALETILAGLCHRKSPEELRLLLVDPKSTELVEFNEDPHLRGEIGWVASDAIEILDDGLAEMDRRYEAFRNRKARTLPEFNSSAVDGAGRLPWWLIVLDEYADLTSEPDDRKLIEQKLKRLAQKGRAAGIHLIVATQKPAAEVISTVIRSNMPAQLGLKVKTATDSRIILDESGAEALAGSGDAFFKTARGMQRVQCAKVSRPAS